MGREGGREGGQGGSKPAGLGPVTVGTKKQIASAQRLASLSPPLRTQPLFLARGLTCRFARPSLVLCVCVLVVAQCWIVV